MSAGCATPIAALGCDEMTGEVTAEGEGVQHGRDAAGIGGPVIPRNTHRAVPVGSTSRAGAAPSPCSRSSSLTGGASISPWVLALFAGYSAAVASWFAVDRLLPDLWQLPELPSFLRPWREVLAALVTAAAVILLGQLWIHGLRLPTGGPAGPVLESVEHIVIFSPFLLLLRVRRHPPETALIRTRRLGSRLLAGALIALVALGVHTWFAAHWARTSSCSRAATCRP